MMVVKTLELLIPNVAPYDQTETRFETYIGIHIVPIIPLLKRFWFTRYGGVGSKKWSKFRFERDDISTVQPHLDALLKMFQLRSRFVRVDMF